MVFFFIASACLPLYMISLLYWCINIWYQVLLFCYFDLCVVLNFFILYLSRNFCMFLNCFCGICRSRGKVLLCCGLPVLLPFPPYAFKSKHWFWGLRFCVEQILTICNVWFFTLLICLIYLLLKLCCWICFDLWYVFILYELHGIFMSFIFIYYRLSLHLYSHCPFLIIVFLRVLYCFFCNEIAYYLL